MLEAGCGAPASPEVLTAVIRAARDFEAAGAHVEPLAPFLTQEMLDGLDHFWRTRALIDLNALSPEKREAVLPFIRAWAESANGFSGQHVFRAFSQIPAMAKAAVAATHQFDYVLSPTAPMTAFPAEWASPSRDPLNPFPHIGFTVAFNMSEQPAASVNCGFDARGPADRPADRRPAVRRRRRAFGRHGLRSDPLGRDAALAGAADGIMNRSMFPKTCSQGAADTHARIPNFLVNSI